MGLVLRKSVVICTLKECADTAQGRRTRRTWENGMTRSVIGLGTLKECANTAQGRRTRRTLGNSDASRKTLHRKTSGAHPRMTVSQGARSTATLGYVAHSFRVPRPMTLRVIKEVVSKVSQGARSTATLGYVAHSFRVPRPMTLRVILELQ